MRPMINVETRAPTRFTPTSRGPQVSRDTPVVAICARHVRVYAASLDKQIPTEHTLRGLLDFGASEAQHCGVYREFFKNVIYIH